MLLDRYELVCAVADIRTHARDKNNRATSASRGASRGLAAGGLTTAKSFAPYGVAAAATLLPFARVTGAGVSTEAAIEVA
jgi:hypothetical protein